MHANPLSLCLPRTTGPEARLLQLSCTMMIYNAAFYVVSPLHACATFKR